MPYRNLPVFTLAAALSLGSCSKNEPPAYAVEEVPMTQVSADLAAGKTTSVALTKAYMARIKSYDGPLHAVILVAPDALAQAAAADKRRADKKALGPLDGVPILVKDNIDVVGMPTTAGSYALIDNLPLKDSEVARRLKAAGVIILGKTNLQQWAGFRTAARFNGSTVGGSPKNPYDLTRSPAGSSSGSGISTAVSFTAAAVGSDTTGSIISPASYTGVVGLRPTVGLISRHGVVPLSSMQDTTGPMARTVADTAMLLNVLAGSDPADSASQDADAHKTDYVKALDAGSLKGVRLGVLRGLRDDKEEYRPIFEGALAALKAQGAELVELPSGTIESLGQESGGLLAHDFKDSINAYLAATPPAVKSRTLADLIVFNKTDEHEKVHGEESFEAAEATNGRQDAEYIKALEYAKRKAGPEGYDRALAQYNISAFVVLSRGTPEKLPPEGAGAGAGAPRSADSPGERGDRVPAPASTSQVAAVAGYPDLTVPMGLVNGLPVGISFIGPAWSDQMLLSYGYAYEQASHARVPPTAYKSASAAQ